MKDYLSMSILLLLLLGAFIYLGFFFGRKYEQQFWTKFYAIEMEKVCLECAGYK